MNANASLQSSGSNLRPYGIFITYLSTCLAVAVFIIAKLIGRGRRLQAETPSQRPPKRHVVLFAILAAFSILSTWGFMFRYFQWSYANWFALRSQYGLDPSVKHWGLWLKETSLFREAWASVVIGHNRYWWSHQIFYFALALGLHSEWKGTRRGITYTWTFMLLGQIVAISFATNLYFLAMLLSPTQPKDSTPPPSLKHTKSETAQQVSDSKRHKWLGPWLVDAYSTVAISSAAELLSRESYWNGPGFMPVLLLPHVVLMIVPTARAILPARLFSTGEPRIVDNIYKTLLMLNLYFIITLAKTTFKAYMAGTLNEILGTLLEHPAVSSVGFDVIFCWISWLCWWQTQGQRSTSYIAL
ncbi:hypothetical protein E8E13_010082 [Curvularia kusanoi]|uniref:Uncharacterized protein n=1 Tax=Curvularia kusanoi TaxID=90978 RepID=A0A9P4TJ31_CURKU|nr:hypothetical protein E8E13_010082 [Curvularia kusanoi]